MGRATLTDNALALVHRRYLNNGESVDGMWRRAAGGNEDYFRLMDELLFLPNSPTLFNAGMGNGCTLSACFVFDVFDCMLSHEGAVRDDSIVRTREKAIAVAKAGGGVGYYFGDLRPKGRPIKTVQRVACGPVAVIRDYHGIHKLVTQGGKRDLAQMGVLPARHADIREFIHCKDDDPQGLSSFNLSVSWDAEWFDQAMSYATGDTVTEPAALFDEQVDSAWSHGCPGLFFLDTVNRSNPNPHLGLMKAPNPCGETPNRTDEPCNLGSLCLWRFVNLKTRQVDWGKLEDTARVAFRFLDDVLDRNTFPHPDIDRAARLTRKLGLGVMGWADMLALLGMPYDTTEAVNMARKLMAFINAICTEESERMAEEKGPYEGFSETKTQQTRRRNETGTSIAPTGSIAQIAGASCSAEPHYCSDGTRVTNEGMILKEGVAPDVRRHLDGFVPKMAHDIHWRWHVEHQAAFQENTDLGVSKTINMPNGATKQEVADAYKMMYRLGCKGGTIYRDGCRKEQVLRKKENRSVYSVGVDLPRKRCLPGEVKTVRRKFTIGGTKGYLHVGTYEDGTPGEIFLRVSKQGSTVSGMLDAWAMMFSNSLQYGTSLKDLVRLHAGHRCEPNGATGVPEIPVCSSIHDFVVRWMEQKFLGPTGSITPSTNGKDGSNGRPSGSGQLCPECGGEASYHGGCLCCTCGWTRCG